jgi:hypothetical protein
MSGNGAENIQEPPQKQTSPSLATPVVVPAILLTTGIVGGILVLTVPFVILPLCGHSLPFMATPAVKVKKATADTKVTGGTGQKSHGPCAVGIGHNRASSNVSRLGQRGWRSSLAGGANAFQ